MKLIDLFVKIANGEKIPDIIKFHNMIFKTNEIEYNYYCAEEEKILEESFVLEELNDEVEIIEDTPKEDKKLKAIEYWYSMEDIKNNPDLYNIMFDELKVKINEIIDKINGE